MRNMYLKTLSLALLLIHVRTQEGEKREDCRVKDVSPIPLTLSTTTTTPTPPAQIPSTSQQQPDAPRGSRKHLESSDGARGNTGEDNISILNEDASGVVNLPPDANLNYVLETVQSVIAFTEDFWLDWLAEEMESPSRDHDARKEKLADIYELLSSEARELIDGLNQNLRPPVVFDLCDRNSLLDYLNEIGQTINWFRFTANQASGQNVTAGTSSCAAQAPENSRPSAAPRLNLRQNFCQWARHFHREMRASNPHIVYSAASSNRRPRGSITRASLGNAVTVADPSQQPSLQVEIHKRNNPRATTSVQENGTLQRQPARDRMTCPSEVDDIQHPDPVLQSYSRHRTNLEDNGPEVVVLESPEQNVTNTTPITCRPPLLDSSDNRGNDTHFSSIGVRQEVAGFPREAQLRHLLKLVQYVTLWIEEAWWVRLIEVVSSPVLSPEARKEKFLDLHLVFSQQVRRVLPALEREMSTPAIWNVKYLILRNSFRNELTRLREWVQRTARLAYETLSNSEVAHNWDEQPLPNVRQDTVQPMDRRATSTLPQASRSAHPIAPGSSRQGMKTSKEKRNVARAQIHPTCPHNTSEMRSNNTSTADRRSVNCCSLDVYLRHLIKLLGSSIKWIEESWWPMAHQVISDTSLAHHVRLQKLLNLQEILSRQTRAVLSAIHREANVPLVSEDSDPVLLITFMNELDRMLTWVQNNAIYLCEFMFRADVPPHQKPQNLLSDVTIRSEWSQTFNEILGCWFQKIDDSNCEQTRSHVRSRVTQQDGRYDSAPGNHVAEMPVPQELGDQPRDRGSNAARDVETVQVADESEDDSDRQNCSSQE